MCESPRQAILIVDDQRANLLLIKNTLASFDADILTATSGETAMELIREHAFDLILLDIMMPGLSGVETADRIRKISAYAHVPIIFVTSMSPDDATIRDVYRSGAIDCLPRTVAPDVLRSKVGNFLELSRHRKSLEEYSRKLQEAEEANLEYIGQLEKLVQRTNEMTMEAERSGLMHRLIFNTTSDAIWVISWDRTVQNINRTFCDLLELEPEEVIGHKCYELLRCPRCQTPDCLFNQLQEGSNSVQLDVEFELPRGKRTFIAESAPISGLGDGIAGIIESYKDITERKRAEVALEELNRKLEHISATDGLTGIANRRRFAEVFEQEWLRMRRERRDLAVIMCDVDYFKLFNDTYGHAAGDDCLVAVARALESCLVRPADVAARYGGEEFVVILPGTSLEGAEVVATKILEAVRAEKIPHAKSRASDIVTLSLGVAAVVPDKDMVSEQLIKQADTALYAAKAHGRNRAGVWGRDTADCLHSP